MKYFLIKYSLKHGSEEQRQAEIEAFIAAINADEAVSGKISYRCLKARESPDYYHFVEAAGDDAVKALQSREFFSRYTGQTDVASGDGVEVVPLELLAQTA
jgi:hypothetical protein